MEQITCVLAHPDSAERETVGQTLEAAGMRSVAVCADWLQTLWASESHFRRRMHGIAAVVITSWRFGLQNVVPVAGHK